MQQITEGKGKAKERPALQGFLCCLSRARGILEACDTALLPAHLVDMVEFEVFEK